MKTKLLTALVAGAAFAFSATPALSAPFPVDTLLFSSKLANSLMQKPAAPRQH